MALTKTPIELSSTQGIVDNSNATAITIDSSGNVGIGTGSPASGIELEGVGNATNVTLDNTTGSTGRSYSIRSGNTGNLDFYDNDATTARLVIDSSGNVGIGESSPSSYFSPQLVVHSSVNLGGITIRSNATTDTNYLLFADGTSGNERYRGYVSYDHNTDTMKLATGASPAITIDSSGNVGINTTSPSASKFSSTPDGVLNVSGNKPVVYLTEEDETDSNVWMGLSNEVGIIGNTGTALAFRTGASTATERMRIDSSGNLLVGKTTTAIGTQGIRLEGNNGKIEATRSGNVVTAFNRTGSDGTISEWMKDGTTVGSIGSHVNGLLIGTTEGSDAFLKFESNAVRPSAWNGSYRDAAIDLGHTSSRFKDLYLSGNVNVTGGKISSYAADASAPYFADGGNVGIRLSQAGVDDIVPCSTVGADRDNAINLGSSVSRFKDLYLGGGVVFGSTGGSVSSKTLDDYETGTWTPVPKGSTTAGTISIPAGHATGTYAKVGELVHISLFLYGTNFTGAGTFQIHGLPFAHQGSSGTLPVQINNPPWDSLPADNQNITGYLTNNTIMTFRATNRTKAGGYITATVTSPSTIGYLRINGTYRTV
jgi:fibronectin-binding autotransporter adhesin